MKKTSLIELFKKVKNDKSKRMLAVKIAIPFFLGLIFAYAGLKFSERSNFCNTCHIMNPYYAAWENSKHKDVDCIQCHYPPGSIKSVAWHKFQAMSQIVKYVTETYSSKPYADISDASCLRPGCHTAKFLDGHILTMKGLLLEEDKQTSVDEKSDEKITKEEIEIIGPIVFNENIDNKLLIKGKMLTHKNVKFDHRPHLLKKRKGYQLRCVSCHSQMVQGKHIEVTYDSCYLCHLKGDKNKTTNKKCFTCHNIPTKTIKILNITYNHKNYASKSDVSCNSCHEDIVFGKGEVEKTRCFLCHNDPEKVKKYNEDKFLHYHHITKKHVACFHCHKEIAHGITDSKSRILLSNDSKPMSPETSKNDYIGCIPCHKSEHNMQNAMYSGNVKTMGIPTMPSSMYLTNINCSVCHKGKKGEIDKNCVKCHDQRFKTLYIKMTKELNRTLYELDQWIKIINNAALDNPEVIKREKDKINKLKALNQFVKNARGEHNIFLASYILRIENDLIQDIGKRMRLTIDDFSTYPVISGRFCQTMCHEPLGIKDYPPKTVISPINKKTMPHSTHMIKNPCIKCHNMGIHKRAPLRKDYKKQCSECH